MGEEFDSRLPLDGIRVVDVTRALAGPYCTMLLGDQGAEVIKIEEPRTGDTTRYMSNPSVGAENSAFLATNRNKKSVTLNLQSSEGQRLARELVSKSDVFVENFRPGKAEELGLGSEALCRENPRLVYCSISGWGPDGPYARRGGYAATAEALGGVMSMTGQKDGPPVKIGVSIVDNLTGLFAKDAITAALLLRERTGRGQRVDTSLLESTVAVLSMAGSTYLNGGVIAGRWGSEHEWNVPWKAFATSDGFVMIACSSEGQFVKLCDAIERPDLAKNENFVTMKARSKNRPELYSILDSVFIQRTTEYWLEITAKKNVAAAPINTIDQVFRDPQVLHRKMVLDAPHTTLGTVKQLGHAQKFSRSPLEIRMGPPTLGEHTKRVLGELAGCSDAQLECLRADGII